MNFSIIMASFNQANFIEQSIKSVLNQSHQNFELIIVDGESTDGSLEIINKYKNNSKIKTVIEKDRGLYHARNKGLFMAKGDFVGFLNTDDYYEIDALKNISSEFNDNPEIDIIYGIIHAVDKEGNFIREIGNYKYDKEKQIRKYIPLPDQATFFRRKKLPLIGLYNSTYSIIADWDFWQRAMKLDLQFIHLPEHIANFRHYKETLTYNPKFETIRFNEIRRLYKENNDVCISPFLIKIYYWHYIKRPIRKIGFINKIYKKIIDR